MKLVVAQDQQREIVFQGRIVAMTLSQRVRLAAKAMALFFGLAVGALFIPVFHFVLTPLFLIVSLIFGFRQFQRHDQLEWSGELKCLDCATPMVSPQPLPPGRFVKCRECGLRYLIRTGGADESGANV